MYTQIIAMSLNMVKDKSYHTLKRMDNHQEIISRLKFIGKLNQGEKINTKHMFVQSDSFVTSFSRTFWQQDNRINCINFIQETINRSFELLITYDRSQNDSDHQLAKRIIKDLCNVEKGIKNLKYTYIDDTKFCCDMDTIIENIKARLVPYDKYIQELNLNESDDIIKEEEDEDE